MTSSDSTKLCCVNKHGEYGTSPNPSCLECLRAGILRMESGIGLRPSYAWKSILHGRDLLKRGLIKSIGNGKETWVWTEN